MDEIGGILGIASIVLSTVSLIACCGVAETTKKQCYYCEHVDLEENNGFCLEGKHYVLEDGVLKEIGDCSAK